MKTTRYTVVTEKSRLGRWLRSRSAAERVARIWADGIGAPGMVRVLDQDGRCVYSVAS